jgi:hypothetical protein
MSLTLSGSETWRYWLRADRLKDEKGKDLPHERQDPRRAHFLMRHLTGREQRALAAALDDVEARTENRLSADYVAMWFAAVRLAGVKAHYAANEVVATEITTETIDDIPGLGYAEARELAYAAFVGAITPGDLGNSDSPSNTAGAESANPADAKAV